MNRRIVWPLIVVFFAGCFLSASLRAQENEVQEGADLVQDPAADPQEADSENAKDLVLATQVRTMILNGETRDALSLIETSLEEDPDKYSTLDVQQSFRMVAIGFSRIRNARDAYRTLKMLFDYQLARLEKKDSDVRSAATVRSLLGLADRLNKQDEVKDIMSKALQATEAMAEGNDTVPVAIELSNIRGVYAATLFQDGKKQESLAIYRNERERLKKVFEANPDAELARAVFVRSISNVMRATDADAEREALYEEHQSIVKKKMNEKPDKVEYAMQYVAALLFRAASVLETQPEKTIELVDEGEKILADLLVANAETERPLQPVKLQLLALRKRAEGQIVIAGILDNPAPAFDAEYWVNGDEQTADTLKGKVVMLDFWAIWCRPCIATFPQIKKLHETYASQGLQIVGVTGRYNIAWDDDKSVPKTVEGEVPAEEEVEAIGKFMEKFELPYPSLVMPGESLMGENFAVTGIPHVVLIDKKGVIRMIKVGVNKKNATAIEEKIKELLAEN